MEYAEEVTGRTWLQLMFCAHSYDMQVCPITSEEVGDQSQAKVQRQRISQRRILRSMNEYEVNAEEKVS